MTHARHAHLMSGPLTAVLIAALLALPFVAGNYLTYLAIQILILSLFALGFNLLFGYTGLLSFGQAGFYAVGAYVCAKILLVQPSLLLGVGGGTVAAAVVAVLLGVLSVRHTRIYFSMLTLAFGMMIYSVAWKWRDLTGGDDGLVGIPRAPLKMLGAVSISLSTIEHYYYFVLAIAVLGAFFMYRLVHAPFGLSLQAIRDGETRAPFVGMSVTVHRLLAFTIAGLYAGLAGALLPPLENTVTPVIAHWSSSADPILATLLGGIYVFSGPIVGSALFIVIKDLIIRVTVNWSIVLGTVVIILVMGFRGGVAGIVAGMVTRPRAAPAPAVASK
jgi:branched-chain amino acid transport system permease protein